MRFVTAAPLGHSVCWQTNTPRLGCLLPSIPPTTAAPQCGPQLRPPHVHPYIAYSPSFAISISLSGPLDRITDPIERLKTVGAVDAARDSGELGLDQQSSVARSQPPTTARLERQQPRPPTRPQVAPPPWRSSTLAAPTRRSPSTVSHELLSSKHKSSSLAAPGSLPLQASSEQRARRSTVFPPPRPGAHRGRARRGCLCKTRVFTPSRRAPAIGDQPDPPSRARYQPAIEPLRARGPANDPGSARAGGSFQGVGGTCAPANHGSPRRCSYQI